MITEQQKHFCREYMQHFVVMRAMRAAGYSAKTASRNGYKMLQNPDIAAYLKELMAAQQQRQELSADAVLSEIRRLAFSDAISFYRWNEKKKKYVLKSPDELTTEQRAAVAEYKPGEYYKLYNKDAALDKLARYFKLYSEIDATVTNFVLMPELKLNGKPLVFEVGKPAPKVPGQKKN